MSFSKNVMELETSAGNAVKPPLPNLDWKKRLLFALLTVFMVALTIEGCARLVWWGLERKSGESVRNRANATLKTDAINFMKIPDDDYGYVLKPGFKGLGTVITENGFPQEEPVQISKAPETLRIMCIGESTTQGHEVKVGNYPAHLRRILRESCNGYKNVEVINAGVAGWFTDQLALRAKRELAKFKPDVLVVYAGWNDFQCYSPFDGPPKKSLFDSLYSPQYKLTNYASKYLRSVALFNALKDKWSRKTEKELDQINVLYAGTENNKPEQRKLIYRFYLQNMNKIIEAFHKESPHTQIIVCTLVGRWPHGSPEEFSQVPGSTAWMKRSKLSPAQAADSLSAFNNLIREMPLDHRDRLLDLEKAFANLDRGKMQFDFCHFNDDGYELMAENIYDGLRSQRIIKGELRPRRDTLLKKYNANGASTSSIDGFSKSELQGQTRTKQ